MAVRTFNRPVLWLITLLLCLNGVIPLHAQDATPTPTPAAAEKGPIVVASKDFSESVIMAKMYILLLREAGFTVEDKTGLGGSPAVRGALESGDVDLYPEYTGTAVSLYHNLPGSALPSDADRLYLLAKSLDTEKKLVWLDRAVLNNTYTLMVRQETVDGGIGTIAELAEYMNANDAPLKICVESEFYAREQDGLKGVQGRYGFAFKEENVLFMDVNETYEALRRGDCEVAEGFATDGRIDAWGFRNLEDTLAFFPIYNPAPVIRQEWLDQFPEIGPLLSQLGPLLDNVSMSQLNARVDIGPDGVFASGDEEDAESVAYSFLRSKRLVKPPAITVASKDYTEQFILGKLLVALLQDAGYEVVDKTGLGSSKVVRQAMENGEVDLYVELTGSDLAVHNGLPVEALPNDADKAFLLAKSLDARKGIIWLDRGPFNDTYAIMVGEELWKQGIQSITDLADYMNANDSPLTICVENDFFGRENDGLPAVQKRYGFAFKDENIKLMDLNEVYNTLRAGQCDVAEGYSTDGRGAAWGFHNLADPLAVFPFYNAAPVLRKAVYDGNPELVKLLNSILPLLDDATMSALNARVDIGADGEPGSGDEETPENVAYSFLRSHRLIKLPPIAVASLDQPEQLILGKLAVLVLQDAGYAVVDKTALGNAKAVRQAMENGEVDLYIELTGTALTVHHGLPSESLPTDPERAYRLAKSLDQSKGIIWLEHGPSNNSYALLVGDELWNQGIQSIANLAEYMNSNDAPLKICAEDEFVARQNDGLPAVQTGYGFAFKAENIQILDREKIYPTLRTGGCTVAEGRSTDGWDAAWGFHNLADPQTVFPFSNPAPVVRKEILDANPELRQLLDDVITLLDDTTVSQLNARVEIGADGEPASGDEETPAAVARDFLVKAALIPADSPAGTAQAATSTSDAAATTPEQETSPTPGAATATPEGETPATNNEVETSDTLTPTVPVSPTSEVSTTASLESETVPTEIVVGSTTVPEEQLLGQLYVLLLQGAGLPVTDRTGLGSPATVRTALVEGKVDLYPELSGRALAAYHDLPPSAWPRDADRSFALAQSLDLPEGIHWLAQTSLQEGPALLVPQALAGQGVHTISDLAAWIEGETEPFNLCVDESLDDASLTALMARYNFHIDKAQIVRVADGETYGGLRNGRCDGALGQPVDGRVAGWQLVALEDDLDFFPSSVPAPVVRDAVYAAFPTLSSALQPLETVLDNANLSRASALVTLGPDGNPATGDEIDMHTAAIGLLCNADLWSECNATAADLLTAQAKTSEQESEPTVNASTFTTITMPAISPSLALTLTTALSESVTSTGEQSLVVSTPLSIAVNARAAPSTQADILELLPANTQVAAVGRSLDNAWLRIILPDGRAAWVFTNAVVTHPETVAQLPVVTE